MRQVHNTNALVLGGSAPRVPDEEPRNSRVISYKDCSRSAGWPGSEILAGHPALNGVTLREFCFQFQYQVRGASHTTGFS